MNWIKQIIGILDKRSLGPIAEPPHYIFQEDYYSIARGLKHSGCYITSEGIKYAYDNPSRWNFYEILNQEGRKERSTGYDKLSFIERNKLLHNLGSCEISFTSSKIEQERIISIIDELTNSELIVAGGGGCDMGLHSRSLLVFDNFKNNYKRILLGCQGDSDLELNSDKKRIIYDIFK